MYVGAAYDRKEVQLARAHAIQGQMQRVVGMNMWKFAGADDLTQPLAAKTIAVCPLQALQTDDADHAAFIAHRPRAKFVRPRFLEHLLNRDLGVQYFRGIAHRMSHLPLRFLLARLSPRQVNAILMRQDLVNGLLLESRGNE